MNEIESTQETVNQWGQKDGRLTVDQEELRGEEDRLTARSEYTIFCGQWTTQQQWTIEQDRRTRWTEDGERRTGSSARQKCVEAGHGTNC